MEVVIDAFRLINPQTVMMGLEYRQTTSNIGHLQKPSLQALVHGLNRNYYSIAINYRKNELEQKVVSLLIMSWLMSIQMLLNLHKKSWNFGLTLEDYSEHSKRNETVVAEMLALAKTYNKV